MHLSSLLRPKSPEDPIPMVTFFVVVFFGGSLAVFFFVSGVLGARDLIVWFWPVSAYQIASVLLYVRWTTGGFLPPGMTRGAMLRRTTLWGVGLGGTLLMFHFWPGGEPWRTVVPLAFLGAVVALWVSVWGWRDVSGRAYSHRQLSQFAIGGAAALGVLIVLNVTPGGLAMELVASGAYSVVVVIALVVARRRGWLGWIEQDGNP